MLNKLVAILLLFVGIINAAPLQVKPGNEFVAKYVEYFSDDDEKCNIGIVLKSDYFQNIRYIDYETGKVTFNIYQKTEPDSLLTTVSYTFAKCAFSPDLAKIKQELNEYGTNTISANLEDLEYKYFQNSVNTASEQYLTTSKYIVAALTMNDEIIDIEQSIDKGTIVLKPGYTYYANDVQNTIVIRDWIDRTKNFWNNTIGAINDSWRLNEEKVLEIYSSATNSISNILVFVYDFIARNGQVLADLNTLLLFGLLPLTIGYSAFDKLTKKISEIGDYDNIYEKIGVFVVMLYFFYFNAASYTNSDQQKTNITNFQSTFSSVVIEGVDKADEMTKNMSIAYMHYKRKTIGQYTTDEIRKILIDKQKQEYLKNIAKHYINNTCPNTYNIKKTANVIKDFKFAPLSAYRSRLNDQIIEDSWRYLLNDNLQANFMSINIGPDFCFDQERKYYETLKALEIDEKILDGYKAALEDEKDRKHFEMLAEIEYKIIAEQGFIAAPLIFTGDLFIDQADVFNNKINLTKDSEEVLLKKFDGVEGRKGTNFAEKTAEKFGEYVYLMMPGGEMLDEAIKNYTPDVIKKIHGYSIASTLAKIEIMKYVIHSLPLVSAILAVLFVLVFYFISILIYMLVSPFLVAYALTNQQTDMIKNYIIKGIVLTLKPILIVISIVLAMAAIKLIYSIGNLIAISQYDLMGFINRMNFDHNGITLDFIISNFRFIGVTLLKGLMMLVLDIAGVVMAFVMVWSGPDMILRIFGLDQGGIDVQEVVGQEVKNKTDKATQPV